MEHCGSPFKRSEGQGTTCAWGGGCWPAAAAVPVPCNLLLSERNMWAAPWLRPAALAVMLHCSVLGVFWVAGPAYGAP
jgi:hypothetical protein